MEKEITLNGVQYVQKSLLEEKLENNLKYNHVKQFLKDMEDWKFVELVQDVAHDKMAKDKYFDNDELAIIGEQIINKSLLMITLTKEFS